MTDENLFVDAAACGDLDGVKTMLEDKKTTASQINAIDKDGRSALHYACLNDDIPLLKVLLADERTDIELRTPKGDCIMHMASLYASLESLKLLFKHPRASKLLNAKNKYGETSLHLCAGSGDKGARQAAQLLLDAGASMLETDQWQRGPLDVAHDNGENPLVDVFTSWLDSQPDNIKKEIEKVSENAKKEKFDRPQLNQQSKATLASTFSQLGSALKGLKKVSVTEKHMFSSNQGKATNKATGHDARATDGKRALSKLIDFPGNVEEIKQHLEDPKVDPAGKDAFGLTALQKFASWNKTELIDMILPRLSPEEINEQDMDGKTALHWACEMASVASVTRLTTCHEVKKDIKDNKGRTPMDIINSGTGSVIDRLRGAFH